MGPYQWRVSQPDALTINDDSDYYNPMEIQIFGRDRLLQLYHDLGDYLMEEE